MVCMALSPMLISVVGKALKVYYIVMLKNLINLDIWQIEVLSNTLYDFAVALLALLGFLIVFKIFQMVALKRLKKLAERTKTDIDDVLIRVIRTIKPPFYSFLAFYLALEFLALNPVLNKIVNIVLIIFVVYQAIAALQTVINYAVERASKKEEEGSAKSALQALGKIAIGILWAIGVLLILSNLGVNVSSLLAGFGIGGIAIALALQNVLGDLFSSFAIFFDKPFVVGDFITVGDKKGTVEKIGIKTTRIKSLHGEEIVISNTELTSTQIQNYKRMKKRRKAFNFGVEYGTPQDKLEKIPEMVKKIIIQVKNVELDRVHFFSFGDSSLDFEVVYYVLKTDYNTYMDANQEIHLRINKEFEKEKISMAFPTRTIHLEKASD